MNLFVETAKLRQDVFSVLLPGKERENIVSLLDRVAKHASNASHSDNHNVRKWNINRGEVLLNKAKQLFSFLRSQGKNTKKVSSHKPFASKTKRKGASLARSLSRKAAKSAKDKELREMMKGGYSKKR